MARDLSRTTPRPRVRKGPPRVKRSRTAAGRRATPTTQTGKGRGAGARRTDTRKAVRTNRGTSRAKVMRRR